VDDWVLVSVRASRLIPGGLEDVKLGSRARMD
jgi:hypothetical protein